MKHSRACSYVHPGEQSGFQASQPAGKGHVSDHRRPQPSADMPPMRAVGHATWSESHRPPVNCCGLACGLGQEAALQTYTRRVPGELPGGGECPREHTGCGGPAWAAPRDPRALPSPLGKERAYAFTLGSAWPWRRGNYLQERQDTEGFMQPLLESSVGSDHLF